MGFVWWFWKQRLNATKYEILQNMNIKAFISTESKYNNFYLILAVNA